MPIMSEETPIIISLVLQNSAYRQQALYITQEEVACTSAK